MPEAAYVPRATARSSTQASAVRAGGWVSASRAVLLTAAAGAASVAAAVVATPVSPDATTPVSPVGARRERRVGGAGSVLASSIATRLRYIVHRGYNRHVKHGSPVCRAERKRTRFD